ncbi:tetratricopeptide repeat protein [Streptomyces aculeolatus]
MAAGHIDVQQMIVTTVPAPRPLTLAVPMGLRSPSLPLRGRDALVDALAGTYLDGRGDGRIQVLHGLNGCGKTALALELVHRLRLQLGDELTLWWLEARRAAPLEDSLRALASRIGLPSSQRQPHELIDAVWQALNRAHGPWLMIVDGADDPGILDGPGLLASGTGWIRPHTCSHGMVLVTTSDGTPQSWGTISTLHAVYPLSDEAAAHVLVDHAGPRAGSPPAACRLARRLGGLPLALCLAGAYLAEVNTMPGAFRGPDTPDGFESLRQALDGPDGDSLNPGQAIASTWRLSLDLLHQRGTVHAAPLLELLSLFADAPIPHPLLHPPTLAGHPGFENLDGATLWRTLKALASLHLIDLLPAHEPGSSAHPADVQQTIRVHPLIRDISRAPRSLPVAAELLQRACHLERAGIPEEPANWPAWELLAPHPLALLRREDLLNRLPAPARAGVAEAAENAARYLQAIGLFRQARSELDRVLQLRRDLLGEDDPDTLSARHNLAGVLHDLGELAAAEAAYRQVWCGWQRTVGDDHRHTLTARHELGRVLHDLGRLDEAEQQLTAVLHTRRLIQGDEHPHTLTARHERARVLHDLGRLDEAHSEYHHVLAERRRLGEDHPRTLTVRHNLACLLRDQGDLVQALADFRTIYTARTRVLGPHHPQTLHTGYRLGCALRDDGQGDQARTLLQGVHQAMATALGAEHPDSQRAARAIAACPPPV